MARIEAHQQRLAEIDAEIQRIDSELAVLAGQRRANPKGGAAELASAARARRQLFQDEREEVMGDLVAMQALEHSAARVAHRANARETLQAALGTAEHRLRLAAALDSAGKVFLAALDELVNLGNATQAAVYEAAQQATPFHMHLLGDPWENGLLAQRRLLIETSCPHAGSFTGPDMQYALVLFLAEILRRVENPQGVAQIAPGWQYTPGETSLSFAEAAKQAHERMEFNAQRIQYCLKEPRQLAEIASGKHE